MSSRGRAVHLPRLARHTIALADGHQVGVSVCGRGVPIVLVHGFTAEGMLYAQTLCRIVPPGSRWSPSTSPATAAPRACPPAAPTSSEYTRAARPGRRRARHQQGGLRRPLDGRAARHRAGRREPDRALAVILLDAIVGEPWDRIVAVSRFNPLVLAGRRAASCWLDTMTHAAVRPRPAPGRQVRPPGRADVVSHVRTRCACSAPACRSCGRGPRSGCSRSWAARACRSSRSTATATSWSRCRPPAAPPSWPRAWSWWSRAAAHSWLLKDPETLPAILARAVRRTRSRVAARDRDFAEMGLAPDATLDEIEAAFYEPDAPILAPHPRDRPRRHRARAPARPATAGTLDVPR